MVRPVPSVVVNGEANHVGPFESVPTLFRGQPPTSCEAHRYPCRLLTRGVKITTGAGVGRTWSVVGMTQTYPSNESGEELNVSPTHRRFQQLSGAPRVRLSTTRYNKVCMFGFANMSGKPMPSRPRFERGHRSYQVCCSTPVANACGISGTSPRRYCHRHCQSCSRRRAAQLIFGFGLPWVSMTVCALFPVFRRTR